MIPDWLKHYHIDRDLYLLLEKCEENCQVQLAQIDKQAQNHQVRLLSLFQKHNITSYDLAGSTGYGYGDIGRDRLEEIFADYFGGEDALVRVQIISGTHAIALGLMGNLRSGEHLISATGRPYDTLEKVIGVHGGKNSLIDTGVAYEEVPLNQEGHIDIPALVAAIRAETALILFQRSKGYQWRRSISIEEIREGISAVKTLHPDIICMVDNCYCEMVEELEPGQVGADLVAGSLIKNPGGSLAPSGGYLVGTKETIQGAAQRLTAPGLGKEMGASLTFNKLAYQGLFQAPLITSQALKGALLAADFFKALGYDVLPDSKEHRVDIVQAIRLNSPEKVIAFCQGIQKASPLDAMFMPEPAMLPGYSHPVIMAGGTFIQGSSIELSADGPIRPPYIVYLQGGIALGQIKLGLLLAAQSLIKEKH